MASLHNTDNMLQFVQVYSTDDLNKVDFSAGQVISCSYDIDGDKYEDLYFDVKIDGVEKRLVATGTLTEQVEEITEKLTGATAREVKAVDLGKGEEEGTIKITLTLEDDSEITTEDIALEDLGIAGAGDIPEGVVSNLTVSTDTESSSFTISFTADDEEKSFTVTAEDLGLATTADVEAAKEKVEAYVGELPVGTEATTVTGYIEEVEATLKEELGELAGALVYKGTVASADELPEDAETGDLYVASAEFEYGGHTVDAGDLLIALDKEGTIEWDIISRDLDGVVTSDGLSEGEIVIADGEMKIKSATVSEAGLATQDEIDEINEKIKEIVSEGGEPNKIDSISVNGVEQEIDENKNVDITVPEKVSDLDNDSNYQTGEEVEAAITDAIENAEADFDCVTDVTYNSETKVISVTKNGEEAKDIVGFSDFATTAEVEEKIAGVETEISDINDSLDNKMDKITDGTENAFVVDDGNGGVKDSEYTPDHITMIIDALMWKEIDE